MKRLLAIILVLALMLPAFSAMAEEKITLNLWHHNTAENRQAVITRAIERFNAEHPNVHVEVSVFENDPYKTKLKTSMGSGEAPDIFHSWGGGWLHEFVKEGLVYDISKDVEAGLGKDISPAFKGLAAYDGEYYGLPYLGAAALVYYNTELFEKFGLSYPATFSELEQVAKTFKENGIIPFALGNASSWPGALTFIYLSMRKGGVDVFTKAYNREAGYTFEDPSYIWAGEQIQKMIQEGWYPQGVNGINYDTGGSRMMVYSNMAAMIVQTTGFVSNAEIENPEFFAKMKTGKYPAVEDGAGNINDMLGGGNVFSISEQCKHKEEAVALLHYLLAQETGQDFLTNAASVPSQLGMKAESPQMQEVMDIIAEATYVQNYYDQGLPAAMGDLHKETTQAIFGLDSTPAEAAAIMEAKAVEVLGPAK